MAIIKHIASKNANYFDAIEYLTMQFDEKLSKPILDSDGIQWEREDYRIEYYGADGEKKSVDDWVCDCIKTNQKYKQNMRDIDIKTHHYIIAYDNRDELSIDEVQAYNVELAKKLFKGHGFLIASHPGMHSHVVFNSVREEACPIEEWMEKKDGKYPKFLYEAGYKHWPSDAHMEYLKKKVMEFCLSKGLHQVDLLTKNKDRKTDKEFYAERNAKKKGTVTQKQFIKDVLKNAMYESKSIEEFLFYIENQGVYISRRSAGSNIMTYCVEGSKKWIREGSLGEYYSFENILERIRKNKERLERHKQFLAERYKYSRLFYDEDGNRRGLLEEIFIFALMVMTNETPDFYKLEWGSNEQENKVVYEISIEKRYEDIGKAAVYCKVLGISSHKELRQRMVQPELSDDDKDKLLFINRQLNLAMDKRYCCGNVYERVFTSEHNKFKEYGSSSLEIDLEYR